MRMPCRTTSILYPKQQGYLVKKHEQQTSQMRPQYLSCLVIIAESKA